MRMTNKIMRNNSLYNINQNKILEDKLSNQMTNQSKITRPSDDPVVAIRALRLRTNVTTVTQYYEKNAPDADSWVSLTGDALSTVGDVLTQLYKNATDSSKKSYTSADLDIVLTQMKSYTKEFYSSGNVDYAGRYIFSGFRTDTPITFTAEDIKEYTKDPDNLKTYMIEENLGYKDISTISYTDWLDAVDTADIANATVATDERDVSNTTLYRFRLAYKDLVASTETTTDAQGNPVTALTQPSTDLQLYINGQEVTPTQFDSAEEAYRAVKNGYRTVQDAAGNDVQDPVSIAYIPSTGEIVFGEEYYQNPNYESTKVSENMQVRVKYTKSSWEEGDINPVHYFHCIGCDEKSKKDALALEAAEKTDASAQSVLEDLQKAVNNASNTGVALDAANAALDKLNGLNGAAGIDPANLTAAITAVNAVIAAIPGGTGVWTAAVAALDAAEMVADDTETEVGRIRNLVIEYNSDEKDQDIYYDVGFNQNIQVNTHADEVFTHGAKRDIDDFEVYLNQLRDIEAKISDIQAKMKEYTEESTEYKNLELKLDAANKAYTYIRNNVQKRFENQITKYQSYIDDTNVAVTNNGTRGSRLELINSRLMEQKATFKDLQSANEDVDVSEVAVQLKSSELTYEAALMATSKIMQTSLMHYI
ncbi:MAG: hypothetical protein NC318_01310 [Blautia sp.]|nr:hypothetical protein [Lachnoclostridium sp.]MCM1210220.1 hypothetical protein [Blautia sp.]